MEKNKYIGWLLSPALVLCATTGYANEGFWQDIDIPVALKSTATEDGKTFQHRRLQLQESQLAELINQTLYQQASTEISLSLPLPDGGFIPVTLVPTPLFADSETHPDLLTWRIESSNKMITSGRAEITELGFHAMLRTSSGNQIFIEPEQQNASPAARNYHSHSRQANATLNTQQRFSCGVLNTPDMKWQYDSSRSTQQGYSKKASQRTNVDLNKSLPTYRLAVAATGEYTQQFGGTKEAALGAIVTTINRINGIFEQELSIQFELVTGSDVDKGSGDGADAISRIIFTNPANDGYTNGTSTKLLTENQTILDKIIGSDNYDIGHVLGTASSSNGLAQLSSLCNSAFKAQGSTSDSSEANLKSDVFFVDFVAHELGHQLGATHTFNASTGGSCTSSQRNPQRNTYTAAEPGSGSTIMSYAGVCGSNDFQNKSDPQFHAISMYQVNEMINATSNTCGEQHTTPSNNQAPKVSAGGNHTIPARTPFILQGSASDLNGDELLYGWDQADVGSAASLGVDIPGSALIRSSTLSTSGVRNVPNITKLLTESQTRSYGESLPRSERSLNFRLSVRDTKGGIGHDDITLTVKNTGQRFEILSPGSNVSPGTQTINWNVAGTDQPPINCSHVDIAYTNDQGKTFTDVLLKTPNDGSASIQLDKTAQRIRVKCNGNIFFALSGTRPHIATYQGDSSQDSNAADSSDNGSTDSEGDSGSDGGGGSLPTGLIFIAGLVALIRRYFSLRLKPFYAHYPDTRKRKYS